MLLVILMFLTVSAAALAAGQAEEAKGARRKAGHYAGLYGLSYSLPGGYALVNRLELSDEQKGMLGKIGQEYQKKRYALQRQAHAKLPKMDREDWRDSVKMAEWRRRREELLAEADLEPPIEKVGDVLTPEQLGKLLAGHAKYQEWIEWLTAYLAKTDAELDRLVGAVPDEPDSGHQTLFRWLALLVQDAGLLERLDLSEEQMVRLRELRDDYAKASRSARRLVRPWTRAEKLPAEDASTIRSVLSVGVYRGVREKYRAKIEAVFTDEQKHRLGKARALLEKRDDAVTQKYLAYIEDVDDILPPRRKGPSAYP
jgi:Spy/CpxP family protein refolding chaperone